MFKKVSVPKVDEKELEITNKIFVPKEFCYLKLKIKNLDLCLELTDKYDAEILYDKNFIKKLFELVAYAKTKK